MEKTIKENLIHKGNFIDVYEDDVLVVENQKMTKRIYIKHPGAACVMALTKDHKICLIKQYRYPIKGYTLEIPAGKKDDINESGLSCAKRELEEETGYASNDIKLIYQLYHCVGYSDEVIDLYLAKNIVKIINPKAMDEDEFIDVEFYTQDEVRKLIKDTKIHDVKTLIAMQYFIQMNFEEKQ
ncbi:MAG: NUDIX hydrolase [Acholeplasmataceae bacterium]